MTTVTVAAACSSAAATVCPSRRRPHALISYLRSLLNTGRNRSGAEPRARIIKVCLVDPRRRVAHLLFEDVDVPPWTATVDIRLRRRWLDVYACLGRRVESSAVG